MLTAWNIASATKPTNGPAFIDLIKSAAAEHGLLELMGMAIVPGPGCNNYGLLIEGDGAEAERFVSQVTMALMPSKYSQASTDDPELMLHHYICKV